jgi:hypothetical protein
MPDLDTLLTEDARRAEADDASPVGFAAACDRALGTARRRRMGTVGASALAVAAIATGSVLAVNASTDTGHSPRVGLAGYDKVLGSVPHDSGSVYVVGPKDEHTAACTIVRGMTVTVRQPTKPDEGLAVGVKLLPGMNPTGTMPTDMPFLHFSEDVLGRGPLYVFTCPKS